MYDFFAIFVPGFFILFLFYACCPEAQDAEIRNNPFLIGTILVLSYLVGIIYHKLIECLYSRTGLTNNPGCITKQLDKLNNWLQKESKNNYEKIEAGTTVRLKYYKAYYLLMEKDCLNSIPVLEAQFAFLRNIIPLCIIYGIAICWCNTLARHTEQIAGHPCCMIVLLFSLSILLFFIAFCIQKKIYYLVWEGYYFLKGKEKNETKKKSNHI